MMCVKICIRLMIEAPRTIRLIGVLLFPFMSAACVSFPDAPAPTMQPLIENSQLRTVDGALLGLSSWHADDPRAIIIGVHGMNDYSNAFALPGEWWAQNKSITTYAIDQRGFGRSPEFGEWVGTETLISDLKSAISAVHAKHQGVPVFVVGHSMGGAVLMNAHAGEPLDVAGIVLAAPGVWGAGSMPFPYRVALNFAAALAPGKTLTGERAGRQSTDNIEILRAMARDPLVIKETRMDAVLGVVRVMGAAYKSADSVGGPTLLLIGERDEIIPLKSIDDVGCRLAGRVIIRRYANGWHLILRDQQAQQVWRDIADWTESIISGEEDAAGDPIWHAEPAASRCASDL